MGAEQLAWLAKELDARADKPALIAMHHNPDLKPMPGGLTDTQKLYDVLLPRKHVKALFYGHTHVWNVAQKDGLHLINLPPVAYVFAKGKPNGFVEVELAATSALLRLTTLASDHPDQGQKVELAWRG
jgi:3',5'-cyclic AMP phosphodiesterase CpdA